MSREEKLAEFVAWAQQHITGDEKAQAQGFELPGVNPLKDAHAALDAAVLAAYDFSARKDLLAQLLELNLSVAQRLERGEAVTPPGVPNNYPEPKNLVTRDCIAPANPGRL